MKSAGAQVNLLLPCVLFNQGSVPDRDKFGKIDLGPRLAQPKLSTEKTPCEVKEAGMTLTTSHIKL